MQIFRLKILKLTVYVTFLSALLPAHARAGDYKDGLQAYIDGDFVLAQEFWLKAANVKDAKSMFNLGLLHEKDKLDNASLDKALNWYRLASDNGYAPAGYHLAQRMLERGGSDDDAIALINKASDLGYAPARRYLGLTAVVTVTESVDGNAGLDATSIKKLNSEYQSASWINRQQSRN